MPTACPNIIRFQRLAVELNVVPIPMILSTFYKKYCPERINFREIERVVLNLALAVNAFGMPHGVSLLVMVLCTYANQRNSV